jgi:16S rRNA (uracil1498-N3)-methyltransferase
MAHRYFVPELPPSGELELPNAVAHHLAVVLRARAGEHVPLGDGRGGTASGELLAVGPRAVRARIHHHTQVHKATPAVQVAFAPPRWQRAEWLLEHGTEVGIDAFLPVATQRTRPLGERLDRWQRIVQAAASQCDRAWLPSVAAPVPLAALLSAPDLPDQRWLLEPGAPALADQPAAPACILLVGPEGGFTADELAQVRAAGFRGAGLGPHVLRSETAALVGAAVRMARS